MVPAIRNRPDRDVVGGKLQPTDPFHPDPMHELLKAINENLRSAPIYDLIVDLLDGIGTKPIVGRDGKEARPIQGLSSDVFIPGAD